MGYTKIKYFPLLSILIGGVTLFIMLSPWGKLVPGMPMNSYRVFELAYLFAVGVCAFFVGERKWGGSIMFLLSLFILALVTTTSAFYGAQSLQDMGLFAGIVWAGLWLCRCNFECSVRLTSFMSLCWLLPATQYSFLFVLEMFFTVAVGSVTGGGLYIPGFSNIRQFNDLQSLLLPVIYYYAIAPNHHMVKKIATVNAVVWTVLLFYTGARGHGLGYLVAGLSVFFLFPSLVRPHLLKIITIILCSCLVYGLLLALLPSGISGNSVVRGGLSNREVLWAWVIENFFVCFWGCGGQSFAQLSMFNDVGLPAFGSPHNMLLSFLYEYGFLFVFVLVVLWGIYLNWLVKETTKLEYLVFIFVVTSVSVSSLFAGALYSPFLGIIFPMLVAQFSPKLSGDKRNNSRIRIKHYLVGTFLFTIFVLSLPVAVLDWHYFHEELSSQGNYAPRFYENGNFYLKGSYRGYHPLDVGP